MYCCSDRRVWHRVLWFAFIVLTAATAWSQVTIDVSVSADQGAQKSSVSTPAFSTSSTNELLLAFVSADNTSSTNVKVNSVSGAGLTWVLVVRTNVQRGAAEIWRAFATSALKTVSVTANLSQTVASSMTVISFAGVDPSGTSGSGAIGATGSGNALSGVPTGSLTTTRNGSLVVGVGNDWDNAIARTVPSGQTMVHQYLAPVGDTYWVQRQSSVTALSGTVVTMNDTAPTTDRYNLSICEILAAPGGTPTYTLSGTVTPVSLSSSTTLTLSGASTGTATPDVSGNYSFTNLPNGTYTVTPSNAGATFTPTSATIIINGAAAAGVNFAAVTYPLSGTVSPALLGSGTTLTLSGSGTGTQTANSLGNYTFNDLPNGTYTVTPSKAATTFTPPSATVTISGGPVSSVNFTASSTSVSGSDWPTYGHDPQRSGNAAGESLITTTTVQNLSLQWATSLDGKVTAQPLFVSATMVAGTTRDVVIAATAANSIYALDAATGAQLWRANFGPPNGAGAVPGGFGISASPAIDRTRGFIYTVSDDGYLHTLNLADGTQASPAVPVILDSLSPSVLSNTATNDVWGGLNLVGNNLYIATASNGPDTLPWWGRIVHVDVSGTTPVVAGWFKVVPSIAIPNGGGGIWGAGGVSLDSLGRVFAAAAADTSEGYTPYAGRMVALAADLGYSSTANPFGSILGSYNPPHPSPCVGSPGSCDMDFGATPIVFQPPSCPAALTAAVNKDGHIYLLTTDDLATSSTTSLQALALNDAFDGPGEGGITGVPAYWPGNNMLFVTDGGPGINGISAGLVGLTVSCTNPPNYLQVAWSVPIAAANDQPPSPPTVANGVVFVGSGLNGSVHAYSAANGTELWNSGSAITGGATFAAPMVAAGKLYVGSWDGFNVSNGGTVRSFAIGAAPPPPSPGVLLGNQIVESVLDDNSLGTAEAFQATAVASGTVATLSVFVDSSSTAKAMVVGIYADSTGHPGALIAQGSSSQLTAGAWNTVTVPGAIVSSGVPYWIAILGTQSGTLQFRDRTAGCLSETSKQTNLTALPSTWTTGTVYASCPLSAYGSSGP